MSLMLLNFSLTIQRACVQRDEQGEIRSDMIQPTLWSN